MNNEIYERLKAFKLMNDIYKQFELDETLLGELLKPYNDEYQTLKEELVYLLSIEQAKRDISKDDTEENLIYLIKNNKHKDNNNNIGVSNNG